MRVADKEIRYAELQAILTESTRWATLSVSIQDIANDNRALVRDLSAYDPAVAVPLLASLLTLPEYQSQCIRLEILVALAVLHCRGQKKPALRSVARWFHQIGNSKATLSEDLAEDVFVSIVHDGTADYRLIGGVWPRPQNGIRSL
jgi:hypothetical protein